MDNVIKNKSGLEPVTSRSSGYKTNSLLDMYYLTKSDGVISSGFCVTPK